MMNIFRSSSVNVENNIDGGLPLTSSSNNATNNIINKRRSRDQRSSESTSSNQIVAITDKQTKSLLRERDAKIAALEKEVLGLQNKISSLSKEQAAMMGSQRKGKKGLTPYGNTVRVSTSKCSAKRRQVSKFTLSVVCCRCVRVYSKPSHLSLPFLYIHHNSFSQNVQEWVGMPPSPHRQSSTLSPMKRHPRRY
jgi:hypothetical protein